jgi:hypothetical protein
MTKSAGAGTGTGRTALIGIEGGKAASRIRGAGTSLTGLGGIVELSAGNLACATFRH